MNTKLISSSLLIISFFLSLSNFGFAKNCKFLSDKDVIAHAEPGCCYATLIGRYPPSDYFQFMENVIFLEQTCRDYCSSELFTYENIMTAQELTMNELSLGKAYESNYRKAYDSATLDTEKFIKANPSILYAECIRRLTQCEQFCNNYGHYLHSLDDLKELGFELSKDGKQLCLKK